MTDLPPPETTPLETLRLATGTPSCVDAMFRSACRAVAAACRSGGPPFAIPLLAALLPQFGNGFLDAVFHGGIFTVLTSTSSSSATTCVKPVQVPWPNS